MKRFVLLLFVCWASALQPLRPARSGARSNAAGRRSGRRHRHGRPLLHRKRRSDGTFTLDADDDALFISIVTPSGYLAPMEGGHPAILPALRPLPRSVTISSLQSVAGHGRSVRTAGDRPTRSPKPRRISTGSEPRSSPNCNARPPSGKATGHVQQAAHAARRHRLGLSGAVRRRPQTQFASLGIPVYGVIGNHDHDRNKYTDREATENYRNHFGPTYYAFDMGRTHYIVLDDIVYHGAKKYDEQIDSLQLAWAAEYARRLPAGSRVCVAMHAPAMKAWKGNQVMESAARLMDAFAGHELHFITGHTHVNSNYDIREGVVEHNVAQICGNLWYDPINKDGTPKGYQLFRECGGEFSWEYRSLGSPAVRQLRVWQPGQVEAFPRKRRGQNLELGPLLDRRLVRGRPLPRRNATHPDRRSRLCGASRLSEKRRAETRQIAASPHLGLLFQSASFGFGTDDRGSRHGPFRTPLFGAHHARKGPMTGRSGDS